MIRGAARMFSAPPAFVQRLVVWFSIIVTSVVTHADPDLWGNLRYGADVIADRGLSAVDPYSFTHDIPWINHEWLSELPMAFAYGLAGPVGLVLMKGALLAAAFWGAWIALRPLSSYQRLFLFILVVWAAVPMTLTIRSQLWSFAAFAWLPVLLRDRRWRWAVPGLFVVWANMHGGWMVGFGALAAWCGDAVVARREDIRAKVTIVILSALATLLTPYGLDLWLFLARTVRPGRPNIQEWQPLWTAPIAVWWPWAIAVAVAVWIATRRKVPQVSTIALAVLALMSLRVLRLVPFFVLFTAASAATVGERKNVSKGVTVPWWFEVFPLAMLIAATWQTFGAQARCLPSGEWRPDPVAASTLMPAHGRLAVWFDWGHYAIWHFTPRLLVSMDGRRETVYSDDVIRHQSGLKDVDSLAQEFFISQRPDYAWYPAGLTELRQWLLQHGYRIDLATGESFVAVRSDLPVLPVLRTGRAFGCFPDSP